ncbi:MAG: hypothetical protein H6702_11080 [Myxococcales bacterium]|nr:hypothetical protein [Myxococcales bacterium]
MATQAAVGVGLIAGAGLRWWRRRRPAAEFRRHGRPPVLPALVLSKEHGLTSLTTAGALGGAVAVVALPWLPGLLGQLADLTLGAGVTTSVLVRWATVRIERVVPDRKVAPPPTPAEERDARRQRILVRGKRDTTFNEMLGKYNLLLRKLSKLEELLGEEHEPDYLLRAHKRFDRLKVERGHLEALLQELFLERVERNLKSLKALLILAREDLKEAPRRKNELHRLEAAWALMLHHGGLGQQPWELSTCWDMLRGYIDDPNQTWSDATPGWLEPSELLPSLPDELDEWMGKATAWVAAHKAEFVRQTNRWLTDTALQEAEAITRRASIEPGAYAADLDGLDDIVATELEAGVLDRLRDLELEGAADTSARSLRTEVRAHRKANGLRMPVGHAPSRSSATR